MSIRKQTGNMYDFVTHTWNVVKGRCEHDCAYCYMKRFGKLKPVRFDEKELKSDLCSGNIIFVGSSCDMFSKNIPSEWISKILETCWTFYDNNYLFQSKNPGRFKEFLCLFPMKTILGTTIESNRDYHISKAPCIKDRVNSFVEQKNYPFERMVTIEPILDFDVDELTEYIHQIRPDWVNIGADSKNNGLPEPDFAKIQQLIEKLSKFTDVRQKRNLNRLERQSNV